LAFLSGFEEGFVAVELASRLVRIVWSIFSEKDDLGEKRDF
jgi:hypothetical protein